MTRRISVPDDHVALILPNQLADELMALVKPLRARSLKRGETAYASVCGDVMLALLEAREA